MNIQFILHSSFKKIAYTYLFLLAILCVCVYYVYMYAHNKKPTKLQNIL